MAYVKTNWVDNTTPIDKTNLNKIEQGIYDNSLVVDAVTNTLNPTDTETYKTAELTEGQITDVIGVNDIVIKGQTEQDGTPTPSAPVDVNVVSGSNVINTSNKNLIRNENIDVGDNCYWYSYSTFDKETYTMTRSTTNTTESFISYRIGNGIIKNNTQYTISFEAKKNDYVKSFEVLFIGYNTSGIRSKTIDLTKEFQKYTYTFTTDATADYKSLSQIRFDNNGSTESGKEAILTIKNVMLVEGTDTDYEPHQGKELPLDLGSIELCKIGDYQDYFYKSGSKWYLHKETIKTIINGSTDQTIQYSNSLNALVYTNSNIANVSQSSLGNIICNRAVEVARNTLTTNNGICLNDTATRILIKFDGASSYNTEALAREYFANNPYEVIYKAFTTTDTEITGTLKEQLEAIYNAPLYEQTNITQTNNDLPMVLDITACKDNINGIKAFIRK